MALRASFIEQSYKNRRCNIQRFLVTENIPELGSVVAQGIQAAKQATDAGAAYHIHRHTHFLKVHQSHDLGCAFGASARKHKSHCGSMFPCPHLVHLRTDLGNEDAVDIRSDAIHRQTVGV